MIADHPAMRRASSAMPALAQPQEPKMNTMRIATPAGYSSRPPRRVWPAVLALATLVGVGGGVLSVTCFGHDNAARSEAAEVRAAGGGDGDGEAGEPRAGAAAGSAGPTTGGPAPGGEPSGNTAGPATTSSPAAGQATAGPPAGQATAGQAPRSAAAGAAAPGAQTAGSPGGGGSPRGADTAAAGAAVGGTGATAVRSGVASAARSAHLTIESVPIGAAVRGPGGAALGKTPLVLDWPISDVPVRFELRLAGYRPKHKQTVVNGNTRLVIELEHVVVRRRGTGPARPSDGLMRPGD
jgi:hypothetical protein